jgi:hypothetical protein
MIKVTLGGETLKFNDRFEFESFVFSRSGKTETMLVKEPFKKPYEIEVRFRQSTTQQPGATDS